MNKQTILSSILSAALLTLAACSNDENKENNEKVDVTKAVEFKVDFADYNDKGEADITRAGSKAEEPVKLEQKMVDLGNGVLAECTLQRDTTKQTRPAATRAIPNDTYTMLAYDAATHTLKGEITGTVTSGVFTSTSANKDIILEAGNTYDFVLFNSKVTRSGNNLTVTRTDADAALIGRKTETIAATPKRQQISFTLKHVGAKVQLKLTGYMNFSGVTATLASVNATDIPSSSTYDASTGTWSTGAAAAVNENITYGANPEEAYKAETYTATSGDVMFMPATDVSKLKLTFTAGNIYKQNMANASLTFNPKTSLQLEQNGAYVLNVKLMYNFLYLFSDGSTGFINETTYGGAPAATAKTPIAVVVSQNKHMAVALKKSTIVVDDYHLGVQWRNYSSTYYGTKMNTHRLPDIKTPNGGLNYAFSHPEVSGKNETWDPTYSSEYVTGDKVKANNRIFPPFYMAARYDPGVTYTGSPALVWYLPSATDWVYVLTALGMGDKNLLADTQYGNLQRRVPCYVDLIDVAFKQVDGDIIRKCWTSTESYWYSGGGYTACCGACYIEFRHKDYYLPNHMMKWEIDEKYRPQFHSGAEIHLEMADLVRAFVEY